MANRFEQAANKEKRKAGNLPEELTAGRDQVNVGGKTDVPEEQVLVPEAAPAEPEKVEPKAAEQSAGLVATYEAQSRINEPRSVRLQVVITQSLNNKISELAKSGKIKSRNDLVNYLLERYLEEIE